MTPVSIAQNLRCTRESAGFTQEEVSAKTGYTVRHIQRLEAEGTLDLEVLLKFSSAFDLHIAKLLWPIDERRNVVLELVPGPVRKFFLGS